jgi:hypothetical protein
LNKAKELIANDPAEVKAKLDEIKATVEKWDNAFKEMAATPAKPKPAPAQPAPKKKK